MLGQLPARAAGFGAQPESVTGRGEPIAAPSGSITADGLLGENLSVLSAGAATSSSGSKAHGGSSKAHSRRKHSDRADPSTRTQAWRNHAELGVELLRGGDAEASIEQLQAAIKAGGLQTGAGVHSNLGVAYSQLGDAAAAKAAFSEAVLLYPTSADGHINVAVLAAQQNDLESAMASLQAAVELLPAEPKLWKLLGQIATDMGQLEPAKQAYTRALSLDKVGGEPAPLLEAAQRDEVSSLRGIIERADTATKVGDHATSRSLYTEATLMQPQNAELLMRRGTAEYWSNDMEAAAASYRQVQSIEPTHFDAWVFCGRALHEARRYAESRSSFRGAIKAEPTNWHGHNMLASAISNSQNHSLYSQALKAYGRAHELAPQNPAVLVNLGHLYREGDRLDEARASYQGAIALIQSGEGEGEFADQLTLADGLRILSAGLLPRVIKSEAGMLADRARFLSAIAELANTEPPLRVSDPVMEIGSVVAFNAHYMGFNDRRLQSQLVRLYEIVSPGLLFVAPHCHSPPAATPTGEQAPITSQQHEQWTAQTEWSPARQHYRQRIQPSAANNLDQGSKIKVGFVSSHFKDHTIGKLFGGMVVKLDRRRFAVTVFTFSGPVDGRSRFIHGHDGRTVVLPFELAQARAVIAGAELDVLFYPDIGLEPLTQALSFARLAPVQAMCWGHPITSGSRRMDYFVSSQR